jgi:hypothetical protein
MKTFEPDKIRLIENLIATYLETKAHDRAQQFLEVLDSLGYEIKKKDN